MIKVKAHTRNGKRVKGYTRGGMTKAEYKSNKSLGLASGVTPHKYTKNEIGEIMTTMRRKAASNMEVINRHGGDVTPIFKREARRKKNGY